MRTPSAFPVGLVLAALCGPARGAPSDPRLGTLSAMQAEITRSMERLRLPGFEAPFFLAYRITDAVRRDLSGRYGAVFADRERRDSDLQVDLRVGSYDFDSSSGDETTIVLGGGDDGPTYYAPKEAPLDDDATALRNALWLATDEKYKEALATYFKKRSKAVYLEEEKDRPASFSREEPREHQDPPLPFPFDRPRWRAVVREVTLSFRGHPEIFDSELKLTAEKEVRWLATSEGAAQIAERTLYAAHLRAVTRAPDGQLLEDGRDVYSPSEAGLPSREALLRMAGQVVEELLALRRAPTIDPYSGPALLEPDAAGVLFHEAVGHRLEGERVEDDQEGQTFRGQVGRSILPPFLSIVDDPTAFEVNGVSLNGSYAFDDQGVPARRTVLVREGKLESYLLSRRPVRPFEHSNGHGRAQGNRAPMARMSNLIVLSRRTLSPADLKAALMAEARRRGKPFGLVIRDITAGNTNTAGYGYQAFKGTPRLVYRVDAHTGQEELVRGVELVGTPLSSLNSILATGEAAGVFNGYCGAESGYVPVSTVAPAVLVGELELQRVSRSRERSPILPAPWSEPPPRGP
ncbi:MAG TPA: TldD/PmbA family protein [Anaeromyxobacter sp.]|nr:TldD/PmbA family protein [Anaeromyxobacter sp.]